MQCSSPFFPLSLCMTKFHDKTRNVDWYKNLKAKLILCKTLTDKNSSRGKEKNPRYVRPMNLVKVLFTIIEIPLQLAATYMQETIQFS